jgi:4-hydroxy-3-methylbut-2-enyl diphosphate reductase
MGQWDRANAGAIHLVETPECVADLEPRNPEQIAFATQTTLSIDDTRAVIAALQQRFPAIVGPRHDDICYATQNRQDAVRRLGQQCDLVLVVGSPNSSNSNRLRELAEKQGVPAYLIDGAGDIRPEWLEGRRRIGVTAGASAPESLVREVVAHLRDSGAAGVRELDGEPENVTFALPKELRLRVVA